MDRNLDLTSLKGIAPIVAALAGAAVALLVAVIPSWRLEALVAATGLASHIAAARPPLGATARSALALASGGWVALLVWAGLTLTARRLAGREELAGEADAPVLRRADAHPDAPARRPLRASEDLGVPAPSVQSSPRPIGAAAADVPAVTIGQRLAPPREVPADLDTPLASVDPAAIPDVPREPIRPVAPLVRTGPESQPEPEERIETFELTPIRRTPPAEPNPRAPMPNSLSALLDRLEQGSARRGAHPAPPLGEALGMLRGLAPREI